MKILIFEWKSFGNEDIKAAFKTLGHSVKSVPFANEELRRDSTIEKQLVREINAFSPDFVFTFNYFPIISLACRQADMRYVSWVYDSPYVLLYSYTVIYPGNYIFVFDKETWMEFHQAGISTIHYLPLAANTKRLSAMTDFSLIRGTKWQNQTDIAFVGSLYTEKHQFFDRMKNLSPYTKGYLEGIMTAQMSVYGYNFIQDLLTPDIVSDLIKALPMQPNDDGVESVEYLYAQYVINRKLTAMERRELLGALGSRYSCDLYTPDEKLTLPGCVNHGSVDYYQLAPYVFKSAKINLNISLRSIKSGIPLRAFEIMGSGGFLMTNYQADFNDCYAAGEDFVYFESKEDLIGKIDYYLEHEKEREEIARNGFEKTASHNTYVDRVGEMIGVISP